MSTDSEVRSAVAEAARRLAEAGLLIGTAGNVSARLPDGPDSPDGRVAVTGTGVRLADCRPEDVTVVDRSGRILDGAAAPTSELALHLGVYDDQPLAAAVVHTHAPFATAVACVLDELPVLHYQQLALGGAIRVAPYATFGTPELADHVRAALDGRVAALLTNHGSVAVGGSLDQAVDNALLLEWLCQLHQRAAVLGTPRTLTAEQQDDVVRAAVERSYGA